MAGGFWRGCFLTVGFRQISDSSDQPVHQYSKTVSFFSLAPLVIKISKVHYELRSVLYSVILFLCAETDSIFPSRTD